MPKSKKEKKVKNKKALLLGIGGGLIATLFIGELFQAGIALLAGAANLNISFSLSGFSASYELPSTLNIIIYLIISLSPIILTLVLFEVGMSILKKSGIGIIRYSTIIFEMILIGYLIVNVFYGAIAVALKLPNNNWVDLINYLSLKLEGGLIFMFFIILILAAYLNVATKRVINYINI